MATAMGIDPSSQKYGLILACIRVLTVLCPRYVPFQIWFTNFTSNWMSIIMQPLQEDGIDFFWLDWQQGEDWIDIPNVNPTFWLNYVFFNNPWMWGKKSNQDGTRPMILHRWGGLGNHRYQVGFSGDVIPCWPSLKFQPYFTICAANVGYVKPYCGESGNSCIAL